MPYNPTIRPERSFEQFGRGLQLIRAIRAMWGVHESLPAGSNAQINANIEVVRAEFDITIPEWHYWCRQSRTE